MEEIIETKLVSDGNESFQLKYYLIEENDCYGVKAEKVIGDRIADKDSIANLLESKVEAEELIKKLADNTVTPFVLAEIIDELFCW